MAVGEDTGTVFTQDMTLVIAGSCSYLSFTNQEIIRDLDLTVS